MTSEYDLYTFDGTCKYSDPLNIEIETGVVIKLFQSVFIRGRRVCDYNTTSRFQ